MERLGRLALLLDAYSSLLTDRQAEILRLKIDEDFSLAEIAENLAISRQAASEAIHRAEEQLERYESILGLYALRAAAADALRALRAGDTAAAEQTLARICQEENHGL